MDEMKSLPAREGAGRTPIIQRSFSNGLTIFLSPGQKGLKTDKKVSGLVDRNRDLKHSRCEDQAQVKRRSLELFDFYEAIVQSGYLATQQGHRLDLSIFLRADDFLGLLGGALGPDER